MDWNDLWAAFALYLVLEGVLPFLNPGGSQARALRPCRSWMTACCAGSGSGSMIAGCVLLFLVRGGA